jgi:hypothetical protein
LKTREEGGAEVGSSSDGKSMSRATSEDLNQTSKPLLMKKALHVSDINLESGKSIETLQTENKT